MATHSIVLGGGCFWCLEAVYRRLRGVSAATSGYAGGTVADPSYEEVTTGRTGHAEVVKVEFDPAIIPLTDILEVFWTIHDPTTPDRQGNDVGPQYRSIILYADDAQRETAKRSRAAAQKHWDRPIVTELKPLEAFYPAEDPHQDYYERNRDRNPYCQVVINPKLAALRKRFSERLRDGA
jgi:methionine-S-sulfoxide reductase